MNTPYYGHTHYHVAPANTQAKTWQRVCLPHPDKIELKKTPSDERERGRSEPEGTRTPNLLIRSQMLYPIKLQVHLSAAKLAKKLNDRECSVKKNDDNPAYYPSPR